LSELWAVSKPFVATAVCGICAFIYYHVADLSPDGAVRRMVRRFEAGHVPDLDPTVHVIAPRADLDKPLLEMLRPRFVEKYGIMVGEKGVGKSFLMTACIRGLQKTNPGDVGVVYVLLPEDANDEGRALASIKDAVDYREGFDVWNFVVAAANKWVSQEEAEPVWPKLSGGLKRTAKVFFVKHGRAMTIVLDAADRLSPELLLKIQEFAKDAADGHFLRIVFVASDGKALPMLEASSAFSRAGEPMEVGPLCPEAATKYLVDCNADAVKSTGTGTGMDEATAKVAVDTIAGGHLSLLQHCEIVVKLGGPDALSTFRARLDKESDDVVFSEVGLTPSHKLFQQLVSFTSITRPQAIALLGSSGGADAKEAKAQLDALIKANILAYHVDGTYTFQFRHQELFFAAKVAEAKAAEVQAEAARWWFMKLWSSMRK